MGVSDLVDSTIIIKPESVDSHREEDVCDVTSIVHCRTSIDGEYDVDQHSLNHVDQHPLNHIDQHSLSHIEYVDRNSLRKMSQHLLSNVDECKDLTTNCTNRRDQWSRPLMYNLIMALLSDITKLTEKKTHLPFQEAPSVREKKNCLRGK